MSQKKSEFFIGSFTILVVVLMALWIATRVYAQDLNVPSEGLALIDRTSVLNPAYS